jgi:ubiquinone/menaquinone biosynthesis C-methylase UbiE
VARELHPLAQQFASVADVYERGRPDYAPAVVGALAAELDMAPGARVLDLGAGTGKLTRALVAFGLDVVAVEPQSALREVLAAGVRGDLVLEGTAEEIPLPDQSVAAVTVADAFHWFDQSAALTEIRRVLRPDGGGLAVLTTLPSNFDAPWASELVTLLSNRRPEHPGFDGPAWTEAVRAAGDWSEPREIEVITSQPNSPDRILDYLASASWIAAMPEEERAELLDQARTILTGVEVPSDLQVRVTIGLTHPVCA